MLQQFPANLVRRDFRWGEFKTICASKNIPASFFQMEQCGAAQGVDRYFIWAYDRNEVLTTEVFIGVTQDIDEQYTQDLANTDQTDFETHYMAACNGALEVRSIDGRPTVRMTTANKTKNFNLKSISFTAGDASTLKSLKADFTDSGDATMRCYDDQNVLTTDVALAVKTVIDWEPVYNYEVIGGWIDIPVSVVGGTSGLWWMSCLGVPDIPAAYGGSVPFVHAVNLELVYTQKVVSDGRATQYLTYDPTHHTNKLRWTILHPVSSGKQFQIYVEIFI